MPAGITLEDAAKVVHAHPAHLVRAFSREYGMPPHRYLTGRRVDLARKYLLDGYPTAEVATLAGLSIDYLVRLEQGRDTNPSPDVLLALAEALHSTTWRPAT